jgi:translation initiation factor IF-2
MVEVSAKTGQNIDKLLDMVLLVADMEDLRADIDVPAEGLVIEAHMETGRGAVVGLLVQQGVLKVGSYLVAGKTYAKIRTLLDYAGRPIKTASPSVPATITGFKDLPEFGDSFKVVESEKIARQITVENKNIQNNNAASTNITGSDLLKMMSRQSSSKDFNVVIKADVQGSLTSVIDSLKMIETAGEINLKIVSSGVGNVTENDIHIASSQKTIVYGFNVLMSSAIKRLSMREGVSVRLFDIIYQLIDDVKLEMSELLEPETTEVEIGKMGIEGVFRTTANEIIVGGKVKSGKIVSSAIVKIMRGKELVGEGIIGSVRRQQQIAKEVFEGEMCGVSLKTRNKLTVEVGDVLILVKRETTKRTIK